MAKKSINLEERADRIFDLMRYGTHPKDGRHIQIITGEQQEEARSLIKEELQEMAQEIRGGAS